MTAEDIMTGNVTTIGETATIAEALELLSEKEIRHLPVLRENGELSGMLSERDLRTFGVSLVTDVEGLENLKARLSAPVSSLMSGDVLTIGRETDLPDVVDMMVDEKVGALPVVDEETSDVVGIVSYVDVLRAARESLA
jgi:acetoin utilization protein AcuB